MTSDNRNSALYHGHVVVPETCTDGWCLGVMTDYEDPVGVDSGDAFVVAPDGSSSGLVWEVGVEPLSEILPPDGTRWGVYSVNFPHVIRNAKDLAAAFRSILPSLQQTYASVKVKNH